MRQSMESLEFLKEDFRPDPKRFAGTKGREIKGLPVREERFTLLENGRDYRFTEINPQVQGAGDPERYMLFVNPTKGTETRRVKPPHWRTISTEGVGTIRVDARPHTMPRTGYFYEVNTKGAGFLKPTAEGISVDDYDSLISERNERDLKILGFVPTENLMEPKNIIKESMFFFERGMRCEVYWVVAELQAVPFKGEMTSVHELQDRGVISAEYECYSQALRVLKDNDRIAEAAKGKNRRKEVFFKAFSVFNQETQDVGLEFPELDIADPEHQKIFFQEFFRRMGANLGILIDSGTYHYHLHSANITMAAEFVDIESCVHWRMVGEQINTSFSGVRNMHIKDMRDLAYCLKRLLYGADKRGMNYGDRNELVQMCLSGFNSSVNAKSLKRRQETDPKNVKKWLESILQEVIVEGKKLQALNNAGIMKPDGSRFSVEDWGHDIEE